VAFDASVIFSSVGGTGVYASQLLSAMVESKPEWTYLLYTRTEEQAQELKRRWPQDHVLTAPVRGRPNAARLQIQLPRRLSGDRVDLYHSFGYFLPLRWAGPRIVTIHDMNVYLNWHSWARPHKLLNWADMAVQTPLAARSADRVITDSNFSQQSICRILRIPAAKVAVIPLAPDPYFDEPPSADEVAEAETLTQRRDFVLFVGILSPQKNLATLVRAFASSGLAARGSRLVIAGSDREGHGASLHALAHELGVDAALLTPGFVKTSVLRALYHSALCLVLPSHGEGFGLPVVEAMASGAPVLAANRQSLPEVVGDAGCLFEPDDVAALAALLARLKSDADFRADLQQRGRERRKAFSWVATAGATAGVYEEVLAARRR